MKTINKFLMLLGVLCLVAACDVTQPDDVQNSEKMNQGMPGLRPESDSILAFRFKARFFSSVTGEPVPDPGCPPSHPLLFSQQGEGRGIRLGRFTFATTFCFDPATNEYVQAEATFRAMNGDELYTTGYGMLVPTEVEGYDMQLNDPIQIVGGTGRFKGAAGEGTAHGLVRLEEGRVDHVWEAEYTISKER